MSIICMYIVCVCETAIMSAQTVAHLISLYEQFQCIKDTHTYIKYTYFIVETTKYTISLLHLFRLSRSNDNFQTLLNSAHGHGRKQSAQMIARRINRTPEKRSVFTYVRRTLPGKRISKRIAYKFAAVSVFTQ